MSSETVDHLRDVQARIAEAARLDGRSPDAITLVAVSKTYTAESIRPILETGHRVFGENRVQEAQAKWPALREEFANIELHLIGPLQTNKVKDAIELFDAIESVDRDRLAVSLAKEKAAGAKLPKLFVQVNTGEEEQKAGIAPQETDAFLTRCRNDYGLEIEGLMCIPPAGDPPAPHFALLARIAARNDLTALSMGMSGDYAIAIGQGATHVRVGSAIFGERN